MTSTESTAIHCSIISAVYTYVLTVSHYAKVIYTYSMFIMIMVEEILILCKI